MIAAETNDQSSLAASVRPLAPDAIVTFSTFYVATVAELAASLGLRFLDPRAAATCHDKIAARRALRAAGLPGPRFREVASAGEAARVAGEVAYPCVMKPPTSSGSTGVRRIEHQRDFREHYTRLTASAVNERGQAQPALVLVEELLDGPEFSVEALTFGRGDTRIVGITRKHVSAPPWFVEMGHDFPADLPDAERRAIEAHVLRALDEVGVDFGPTHTELRLTPQGPVIVEINPRLAGGMIPELVRLATGVDLIDAYLRMLVGDDVHLDATRRRRAAIRFLTAPRPGRLASLPSCDDLHARPGVDAIEVTARVGSHVVPPRDSAHRLGYVICDRPERADEVLAEMVGRLQLE
ncbi:MAG: ATP-grasp domain-containing protein [Acidimicrobiia bacterium]|nr:ATP-grasp domain-containing protein [Acidimicrobiia bacterium]